MQYLIFDTSRRFCKNFCYFFADAPNAPTDDEECRPGEQRKENSSRPNFTITVQERDWMPLNSWFDQNLNPGRSCGKALTTEANNMEKSYQSSWKTEKWQTASRKAINYFKFNDDVKSFIEHFILHQAGSKQGVDSKAISSVVVHGFLDMKDIVWVLRPYPSVKLENALQKTVKLV